MRTYEYHMHTKEKLGKFFFIFKVSESPQPRGLVVTVSDYWLWGPGFDSRFYRGDFYLKGKISMVTMVWVV
jgi:hypothetical protein